MDESHKTLHKIQERNLADANRVGRIIYDRAGVRQLFIAGEHPASAWQPAQRSEADRERREDKAINIRVRDRERNFAGLDSLLADLEGSDQVLITDQVLKTRLDELTELREAAITIADKAWCEGVEDFDLAHAALDAIEDLDLTLGETLAALAQSTAPVTASE